MGGFLEELLMYFSSVCISVYVCSVFAACCPYLMVWFGFHYGTSRRSVQSRRIGTNCPVGDQKTICSRRVLNTLQQWRVWHGLNGAYAASIDFHIWEHLYYCWSPISAQQAPQGLRLLEHSWSSRFNDRLPIVGEELCCLFREASLWLRFYNSQCVAENSFHCRAGFQLQCPWSKACTDYLGNLISCWKWQIRDRVNTSIWHPVSILSWKHYIPYQSKVGIHLPIHLRKKMCPNIWLVVYISFYNEKLKLTNLS